MISRKPRVSFLKRPRVDRYPGVLTRVRSVLGRWISIGRLGLDRASMQRRWATGGEVGGGAGRRGRRRMPKTAVRARLARVLGRGASTRRRELGGGVCAGLRWPERVSRRRAAAHSSGELARSEESEREWKKGSESSLATLRNSGAVNLSRRRHGVDGEMATTREKEDSTTKRTTS